MFDLTQVWGVLYHPGGGEGAGDGGTGHQRAVHGREACQLPSMLVVLLTWLCFQNMFLDFFNMSECILVCNYYDVCVW